VLAIFSISISRRYGPENHRQEVSSDLGQVQGLFLHCHLPFMAVMKSCLVTVTADGSISSFTSDA
jgi:hypothetical protein